MGLQGVEMVLLGFNTPSVNSQKNAEGLEDRMFHTNSPCRQVLTRIQHGSWRSPRRARKMVTI